MSSNSLSLRCLYLFLFTAIISTSVSAQELHKAKFAKSGLPVVKDSLSLRVSNLEALDTLITATDTTYPYYRLFYIYGDGNYETRHTPGTADITNHRFMPLSPNQSGFGGPSHFTPRVYALKIYSNGLPPPDRMQLAPPVIREFPTDTLPFKTKTLIQEEGRTNPYLDITTHAQAKIGEPLILVLAFKNASSSFISSANLYLLLDSDIEEYSHVEGKEELSLQQSAGQFSEFPIEDVLVHTQRADQNVLIYNNKTTSTGSISDHYKKMMVFELNNLEISQEEHIFLEVNVDSTNFDRFNSENLAKVNFATVLVATGSDLNPDIRGISQEEENYLDSIGFTNALATIQGQGISQDSFYTYSYDGDSTHVSFHNDIWGIQDEGRILDMATQQVSLVRGHDPNFLRAQACKCPDTETRNKLFITIRAENDGFDGVNDIYYDINLPAGITAADIDSNAIAVHPGEASEKVSFEIINDQHIRWALKGRLIRPTTIFGVGHPDTYAEIQFQAFTDEDPEVFHNLLIACIRFDDPDSDEVLCTYPEEVQLLSQDAAKSLDVLTCFDCDDDPQIKRAPASCGIWILIITIVVFSLLFVWYRVKKNEE